MNPIPGYDKVEAYTEVEKLPAGGYILKIMKVEYQETEWGKRILLSFDINEGEYAGFFNTNYRNQKPEIRKWKGTYRLRIPPDNASGDDEWKIRTFKSRIKDFEDSNPGFHWDWDEQKLKGKLIGGIFNEKEYDYKGRHGFYTQCYGLTSVDKIRKGKFKIPEAILLNNSKYSSSSSSNQSWMNIPEEEEDILPFD